MTEEFWTEARVAELKQLYVVEHRSRTEIMRILQITRYNLAAELNKLGLCINDAHHLTEEERGKIVALCHAGHSLAEIGRQMGAAGSTIKNVLARVQLRTMPSTRVMAWTEEEKSALVTMVGQGMGYKEIAGSTIFAGSTLPPGYQAQDFAARSAYEVAIGKDKLSGTITGTRARARRTRMSQKSACISSISMRGRNADGRLPACATAGRPASTRPSALTAKNTPKSP